METTQLTINNIREILKNYLQDNDLVSNGIQLKAGCNKSDGYVSNIYKITLAEKVQDKVKDFIIKSAPNNDQFRSLLPVRKLYLSEIHFYENILPALFNIVPESRKCDFKFIPKYIGGVKQDKGETLILEDVRPLGFQMRDKRLLLDKEHLIFAMREYGKYHALSFALKYKNRELYDELATQLKDIHGGSSCLLDEFFYDWFRPSLKQTAHLFKSNSSICDKLKNIDIGSKLEEVYNYRKEDHVFAHLDCWSNNMLFKYQDSKPISMFLLDFQYVYNTSPVFDIAYLFYVGAPKTEYSKYEYYLDIYNKTLSEYLNLFGLSIDMIYHSKKILEEWRLHGACYGYLRAILGIPLSLRNDDEIVDIKDVADNGLECSKALSVDEWSNECKEWIETLTLHMIENNFL